MPEVGLIAGVKALRLAGGAEDGRAEVNHWGLSFPNRDDGLRVSGPRRVCKGSEGKRRKVFFFEKKKQKTFGN